MVGKTITMAGVIQGGTMRALRQHQKNPVKRLPKGQMGAFSYCINILIAIFL